MEIHSVNSLLASSISGSSSAARIAPAHRSHADEIQRKNAPDKAHQPTSQVAAELELSPEALEAVQQVEQDEHSPPVEPVDPTKASKPSQQTSAAGEELTEEEQDQVKELKQTDREVRSHEQAHLSAAGPYAKGGPTFEYQEGPDGQRYAVGGEVQIDTSSVPGDPEATIQKARVIRAAALSPAEPSSQDRAVASAATKMESQARQELQKKQREERAAKTSSSNAATSVDPISSSEEKSSAIITDLQQKQFKQTEKATIELLGKILDAVA